MLAQPSCKGEGEKIPDTEYSHPPPPAASKPRVLTSRSPRRSGLSFCGCRGTLSPCASPGAAPASTALLRLRRLRRRCTKTFKWLMLALTKQIGLLLSALPPHCVVGWGSARHGLPRHGRSCELLSCPQPFPSPDTGTSGSITRETAVCCGHGLQMGPLACAAFCSEYVCFFRDFFKETFFLSLACRCGAIIVIIIVIINHHHHHRHPKLGQHLGSRLSRDGDGIRSL